MFYRTDTNKHGLPHDPFKALVAPRPIGWIGSQDGAGHRNLAPYSFFQAIADRPKLVMFSSVGRKDSVRNIEATGCFSANMVGAPQAEAMNRTSAAVGHGVDEFELGGLEALPCTIIDAPRVAGAFATLECLLTEIRVPATLDDTPTDAFMVFGQVVAIHLDESVLTDGLVDASKAKPVSRLGYFDYAITDETFVMRRPA